MEAILLSPTPTPILRRPRFGQCLKVRHLLFTKCPHWVVVSAGQCNTLMTAWATGLLHLRHRTLALNIAKSPDQSKFIANLAEGGNQT
ncbi:hypothetical protein HDE77_002052 [Rhodanobacter sp. MP7CTX1]|nr:hypothetical protein [Rhodanobacter sp. MP7CTX1]